MPNLGEQFSEEGYRTPNLGDASLGTVAEASFEVGMRDLAFTSMYQWWNRRDVSEVAPDNVMSRTESEDMISSHGLNPHDFKLDDDNIRGDVQSNIWLNQRMSMLNNLTSQASSQRWSATATSLGSGMGAELLDPVNYIASFLAPVKMAGAGTNLGHRFLARAKQSVGESLAVGVMGQPFMAEARLRRGEEYDTSTFIAEVGLDALIGTTIAGTLGGLSDIAHIATGRQLTGDPIIAEGQAIIDERSSLRYADKEHNDIMRQAVYFDYHNRTDSIDELMAPEYVKEKARTMARIDNAQHNGILTPEQANSATARVNGAASPISVRINPDGTVKVDVTNPPVHNMDMEGMPLGIKTRVDNGMEVVDAIKEYGEEVAGLEMRAASDVRKILGEETPDSLSEWVSREGGIALEDLDGLIGRASEMVEHPAFKTGGSTLNDLRVKAKDLGYIPHTATDKEFVKAILKDVTKGNVYSRSDLSKFSDWVNASLGVIRETDLKERAKIADMENTMNADLSAYIKDMNDRMIGTKYSALLDPDHMDIIEKSEDLPELETELGKQPDMQESIKRDFGEDSDIVTDMEAELNKAARTQKDFLKAAEEIMACQLGIAPK